MDCKVVHHNLFDYQENNLEPGILKEFEAHLSECESCRRLVSAFQSFEDIIERARKTEPHPFMLTRIVQHIENELTSSKENRFPVLRPILLASTFLFAVAIGIVIGKANSDRFSGIAGNKSQIENLKTELFIHDFIDENKTLLVKE